MNELCNEQLKTGKICNSRFTDDRILLAADELELTTLLKRIEHFSRKEKLILNRANCSMIDQFYKWIVFLVKF